MKYLLKIWILAIGLAALPGLAQAADIFLLITSQGGDSTAKGHENWIRVSSLDWNVEATTSWASSGASVGKPQPGELKIVLPTGFWSQYFARLITQGKAIPRATFDAMSSDGRPLYRVTVDGMFITEYRLASLATTPLPQDHVEAVFKIAKIEYFATTADGRLITTTFEWNVATGISTPGI